MKTLIFQTIWVPLLFIGFCVKGQEFDLSQSLNYAKENNKAIAGGQYATSASDDSRKAAWAGLFPQVSGTANLDHYWKIPVQILPGEIIGQPGTFVPVQMGTPWMTSYGLEASIGILDATIWNNIKLTALQQQAARSNEKSLHKLLEKNVSMAWYNVQIKEELVTTSVELLQNQQKIHQVISLQFEKGLTDKISLNQSQKLVNDREKALKSAESLLEQAYLDLKFWMGFPLHQPMKINIPNTDLPSIQARDFSPDLIPDYRSRKIELEVSKHNYRSSISALYPSLRLNSSYKRLAFGDDPSIITGNEWFPSGVVSLQLRVPIFSLQDIVYNPARQRALWNKASLELEDYENQQKANFHKAWVRLNEALVAIEESMENVELAKENEELVLQKLEKGVIDMVQFIQVQQDKFTSQERFFDAKLYYMQQYVEINYLQNEN